MSAKNKDIGFFLNIVFKQWISPDLAKDYLGGAVNL